jgi:hypothetical protein
MNDEIVTSDDAAKIMGLYLLLRVKTPKSLSKADIPHTEAMELIDEASKTPLQRFMEEHVLSTIQSRDEYKKEKARARLEGRKFFEMSREVENDNLIEAWTDDLWKAFELWREKSCKDYLTYYDNKFKFATGLGKMKGKWGVTKRVRKIPGTRVNDTWWTINIILFCERVGLDIEDMSVEEMVKEDMEIEERSKTIEEQKKHGNKGLDYWARAREKETKEGAEVEDWEEDARDPLSYDDSISDLWLEANKFVDSLYTVNRAVRKWWMERKEREEEDREEEDREETVHGPTETAPPQNGGFQSIMRDLASKRKCDEHENPKLLAARQKQIELKRVREEAEQRDLKKTKALPSLFEERLAAKGIVA